MSIPRQLAQKVRRAGAMLWLALRAFARIGGPQSAAAFAHYAFFSLFPLVLLSATIASLFIDRNRASMQIIAQVEAYIPIGGERQRYIFDTLSGVVRARGQAGVVSSLMLGWAAMGCFATLIRAANRAWGTDEHQWWRLPFKSLGSLAITLGALLPGIAAPVLVGLARDVLLPVSALGSWIYASARLFIPSSVIFLSLSLFYRLAPRRPTRFAEVWVGALCATALLQAAEGLFVVYLKSFATLNAVYGAFGAIMALLLWIDLSGCIVIFGACLCAAQKEGSSGTAG